MRFPKSHYVYEFSYPEGMPDLAGIIFYVGKGTSINRMDVHFAEASNGCNCDKCNAIRSIWRAGLAVVRRIVFESTDERETLREEDARIALHRSPHLTNKIGGRGNHPQNKKSHAQVPNEQITREEHFLWLDKEWASYKKELQFGQNIEIFLMIVGSFANRKQDAYTEEWLKERAEQGVI